MSALKYRKITYTDSQRTAFGEEAVATLEPTIQFIDPNGVLNDQLVEQITNNGTITVSNGLVTLANSTGNGDYATLLSTRNCAYHAGQGNVGRFSFMFDDAAPANSLQIAGMGTAFNGFFFGYNGDSFGVMHRYNGAPEIYKVQVTSSFTGAGTVVLTLNSVAYNISVASAAAAATPVDFSAHQIEVGGSYTGWDVSHSSDTVYFIYKGASNLAGTFSIDWDNANTGGDGSLTKVSDGAAPTETWTAQADWNMDTMDGTGRSLMTLDPAKLNVYQIRYQYLGAGAITFSIEDDNTGSFVPVHQIEFANSSTQLSLSNPTLRMLFAVASLGSTTALSASLGSFAAFSEGVFNPYISKRYAFAASRTGITTETVVCSIQNNFIYNNIINHSNVYLNFFNFGVESTKPVTVRVYKGGTLGANTATGYTDFTPVDSGNSCVLTDTVADAISGGKLLFTFATGKSESRTVDISNYRVLLLRGETVTVTCESTGSTEISVGINWVED